MGRLIDVDVLLNDIMQASLVQCNRHLTGYIDAVEIIESQPVYVSSTDDFAIIAEKSGYMEALKDMEKKINELKNDRHTGSVLQYNQKGVLK